MAIKAQPTEYFGHSYITRKIIGQFINFFIDKFYIERFDEEGNLHAYIKPPIQFANRDRLKTILSNSTKAELGNSNATINSILPRMSLFLTSMNYAANRKLPITKKIKGDTITNNTLKKVLTPVPWDLDFDLSIIAKSYDDLLQLVEQIAPFFTPTFNLDINILEGFQSESIPFVLSSIALPAEDEYGAIDSRILEATFTFKAEANFYYIRRDDAVIRNIIMNYYQQREADYKLYTKYELTENSLTPAVEVPVEQRSFVTTKTDY